MEKRKIIVKYLISGIFLILFSVNNYGQNSSGFNIGFENKNDIIEWSKKEFGHCNDTTSLKIQGKEVFILFGDYASGVMYKTIFVFYNIGGAWGLFCMRATNTSKVMVGLDEENYKLIFKSKSGKELMILPFETLKLEYDSSEQ